MTYQLLTFCDNCGSTNTDWVMHNDSIELICCLTCNTLYEVSSSVLSLDNLNSKNQ